MKPVILHISNDYPDPLFWDKTKAISNLVEATPQYRHVVYSLNRADGWCGIASIPFGEDKFAVAYGALPKGLFWHKRLLEVAQWILNDLSARGIVPDLVQAHKLTVEGIVGLYIAKALSLPLVCDIQGNSDQMILQKKIDLRKKHREIANYSSLVFPYAPWSIRPFRNLVGLDEKKCVPLPVLPGFDCLKPSKTTGSNRLITMMRFQDMGNKNLKGIIASIKLLRSEFPNITLDVYGGGRSKALLKIKNFKRKLGVEKNVVFKGPINNNDLPNVLSEYAALVVPSFAETYGLVYAEALFCGVPVLYSKGRAIDGYFNPQDIGYACDPESTGDIAQGIRHILTNEQTIKTNIESIQKQGRFDNIRRAGIIATYTGSIDRILAQHHEKFRDIEIKRQNS